MAIQENRLDEPKSEGIPRLWLTLNECGVQLGRVQCPKHTTYFKSYYL